MNPDRSYLIFAVVFSTAVYFFELYLQLRQHSRFSIKKRPAGVKALVTEDEFKKSQVYNRDKSSFSFLRDFIGQLQFVATCYFFVLPWAWNYSATALKSIGYTEESEIAQSIMFFALTSLVSTLIDLPLSWYATFVIEERHGFNKQTQRLFFTDLVKSTVLSLVIGSPLLAGFLMIIEWAGPMFPLYVWAFLLVVKLVFMTLYPELIQPLFNKVEPLEDGPLRTKVETLAKSIDYPLTKLFKIDGSKRSSHSNAYMYGFFKNKRIVIFDTLIEQCTDEQIVAVLGHELGHWKLNHTLKMLLIGEIQTIFMFLMFQQVIYTKELYQSFGFEDTPAFIGLFLFTLLYAPILHVTSFALNWYSRYNEFAADQYAEELGRSEGALHTGEDLKAALLVLQKENSGNIVPDPWYATYHYSHPPMQERLAALSAAMAEEEPKKDR